MKISELMEQGDVNFGTSGIRAHESKLTDLICYACMKGLLQFYKNTGMIKAGGTFAIAGDLRDSTDRIMLALANAVKDSGYNLINSGKIPTPAITLFGIENGFVSGMVTASHNPGDNNGFKPNTNIGELMKHHEPMMKSQVVTIPDGLFDEKGTFRPGVAISLPAVDDRAEKAFIQRYLDIFPHDLMKGMRVGVFQHKAVGRDMLAEVLKGLGAEVIILKRTESFMQVDTEAVPEEVVDWGRQWTKEHNLNALFMMDPDSDRPLAAGPSGNWWRGDVLGIVAAWALGADFVATPVSCNTALEKSGLIPETKRTKIGSPYVIAAMLEAVNQGYKRVVGYEANGGFLVQSDIPFGGKIIKSLPTRDSFLPMLLLVHQAKKLGISIDDLLKKIPSRHTHSAKITLSTFEACTKVRETFDNTGAFEESFGHRCGRVVDLNSTDGYRATFTSGTILHVRGSGNAPDLRAYSEDATPELAEEINALMIEAYQKLV